MRKNFKLALGGAILVLGIVGSLSACQSAGQTANPASAAATPVSPATGANQSNSSSRQQPFNRPVTGVVDRVGDKEFALKSNSGADSVTVRVDDQTAIRKQVAGTLADIKQGEEISLRGEASPDGTIAATSIQLIDAAQSWRPNGGQPGGGQPRGNQNRSQSGQSGNQSGNQPSRGQVQGGQVMFGTVDSVENGVITVSAVRNSSDQNNTPMKATVSDKTSITRTTNGAFSDITVGANVLVTGQTGADGTITASSVQVLPPGAGQFTRRQ